MHIEHTIDIDAPVAEVWELNTNVAAWPSLMPTVTTVERLDDGPLRVGSQARIKQPAQRIALWTVSSYRSQERFEWATTNMGMHMHASHSVVAAGDGCRNTLTIDLDGVVARLLGPIVRKRILATIATENAAFKREAEAIHAT